MEEKHSRKSRNSPVSGWMIKSVIPVFTDLQLRT